MELRVRSGRAALTTEGGHELAPEVLSLGPELESDLHEWAKVADTLPQNGRSGSSADAVSRRGRVLAARVATELAEPVRYLDPMTSASTVVESENGSAERRRFFAQTPGEPTPWATGLTAGVILAAIVAAAVLALTSTVAEETNGWLAAGAALLFTAGVAPSLWLGRSVPVLRWVCGGAAAGLALSWVGVLAVVL